MYMPRHLIESTPQKAQDFCGRHVRVCVHDDQRGRLDGEGEGGRVRGCGRGMGVRVCGMGVRGCGGSGGRAWGGDY